MDKRTNILVIGAGPAGIVSAVTARRYYQDKNIIVLKGKKGGVIPCGIPYMFSSLNNPDDNKLSTAALDKNCIEVVDDEAVKIDRGKRTVETKSNNK